MTTRRELFKDIKTYLRDNAETGSGPHQLLRDCLALFKEPTEVPISNGGVLHIRPYSDEAEGVLMTYIGPGKLSVVLSREHNEWRFAPQGEALKEPWYLEDDKIQCDAGELSPHAEEQEDDPDADYSPHDDDYAEDLAGTVPNDEEE